MFYLDIIHEGIAMLENAWALIPIGSRYAIIHFPYKVVQTSIFIRYVICVLQTKNQKLHILKKNHFID